MQDIFRDYPDQPEPYRVLRQPIAEDSDNSVQIQQREQEYFKSLYPVSIGKIQLHVEEACDRMEYKDSPMYDEYPDRVMVNQVSDAVMATVLKEMEQVSDAPTVREVEEVEVYELRGDYVNNRPGPPPWGPPPGPPPWGPPHRPPQGPPWGPPPWGPPPGPPPWGPPPGPPPWGPPPRPPQYPNNWMNEMVRLLLLNEMQYRRCRNRNCR